MGRTVPTIRMVIEEEITRLRKLSLYIHDPLLKKSLEEILSSCNELMAAFKAVPLESPVDMILFASLLKLYARMIVIEQKLASKCNCS